MSQNTLLNDVLIAAQYMSEAMKEGPCPYVDHSEAYVLWHDIRDRLAENYDIAYEKYSLSLIEGEKG